MYCGHRDFGNLPNSGPKLLLKLSMLSMSLSMLWQMSLVGRLGLGALSWVHIGLGDKVRVSISYYLIYVKTCSEQFGTWIQRTAKIFENLSHCSQGSEAMPTQLRCDASDDLLSIHGFSNFYQQILWKICNDKFSVWLKSPPTLISSPYWSEAYQHRPLITVLSSSLHLSLEVKFKCG